MRAWGGLVGGLVLAVVACGQGTGTSGIDRVGQTQGQGEDPPDGGQPSCSPPPGSFTANAGTGSECGLKPVLGMNHGVQANVPDGGECGLLAPADGSNNLLFTTNEPNGAAPFLVGVARSYHFQGIPLGQTTFGQFEGQGFFPLASGWVVQNLTGGFQAATVLVPYSADLQRQGGSRDMPDPDQYFG
jgi:hypothetical protein